MGLLDDIEKGTAAAGRASMATGTASSNRDLMAAARGILSGNWMAGLWGYLLFSLLAFSFLFLATTCVFYFVGMSGWLQESSAWKALGALGIMIFLLGVFIGPLLVGRSAFYLGIAQECDTFYERFLSGFRRFGTGFSVFLLSAIAIVFCSLFLVFPGVIAFYSFCMVFRIVADDPTCGAIEAMRRSRSMMKGNKWSYFCLQWRFFGWNLLSSFLGGFGELWLISYRKTSSALFYEEIK